MTDTIVAYILIVAGSVATAVWAVREHRAERAAVAVADEFLGRVDTTVRRCTHVITEAREAAAVEAFIKGTATAEDAAIVETIVDFAIWDDEMERAS